MGRTKLNDAAGMVKGMRRSTSYSTIRKNRKGAGTGGPLSSYFQNQGNVDEGNELEDSFEKKFNYDQLNAVYLGPRSRGPAEHLSNSHMITPRVDQSMTQHHTD